MKGILEDLEHDIPFQIVWTHNQWPDEMECMHSCKNHKNRGSGVGYSSATSINKVQRVILFKSSFIFSSI